MRITAESETTSGLAFETSSALGSVALGRGDVVLEERVLSGARRHAVEFIPTIEALCKAHAVEPTSVRRIFVSSGPGSFTGLRIGVTAARMIGWASGASLVAVPTLEVIAQNALDAEVPPDRAIVVLDAKRGRVYTAVFALRANSYVALSDPVEADLGQFIKECTAGSSSYAVLGEGVPYHRPAIESSGVPILPESLYPPRARTVYRLGIAYAKAGTFSDHRTLTPTYVRPPEAQEKWEQRHGKARS